MEIIEKEKQFFCKKNCSVCENVIQCFKDLEKLLSMLIYLLQIISCSRSKMKNNFD